MAQNVVTPILTKLGTIAGHPLAFMTVIVYGVAWFFFERHTFDWHGVATLATWMMTIFITRSAIRDTQALHAKLDELLMVEQRAQKELTRLDEKELEDIEKIRESIQAKSPDARG